MRAKKADRKFVLMRIDDHKNTTGPYMIPLESYEDCPDQDRYADRTDFAKEAKKGAGSSTETAINNLPLTKTSEDSRYSADFTQAQREDMQYRDHNGNFLGGPNDKFSKSHRDGGNCFRIKVCTYEYDADTKQLVCRDPNRHANDGGVLPRFAYFFPRDIHQTDVQIQYYLTQFTDKTISINEKGYATASHVQKINLYAHKTMVGEHVDWDTATFTSEQDQKINVDWSSYNGTEAIGMQSACQNLDPEKLWKSTEQRVAQAEMFSGSPSSTKLTEWASATSDKVDVKPFISATADARDCDKQVTIVPWSYRGQPMNFSVDITDLGTKREGFIPVKMSWTKLELLKQDGTFANAGSASNNAFVWNHTDFVHRGTGMSRQCTRGESGKDKCNTGIVYPKGHSKRVDPMLTLSLNLNDAELDTMFNAVDASFAPHKQCGNGNAVMRLTLRMEVPREGAVDSVVPPLVETRTIMWVRDQQCDGSNNAGTVTIESDPSMIKFRNETADAEYSTTSKDMVETDLKMATSCIHAGGNPDLCKRSRTTVEFEQSSANTVAGGAARPLNCDQYQTAADLAPGKWEID